jgi:hypothetical protein
MGDCRYQGGTSKGSKWGCATAAVIGAPVFFFLLIGDALGDCAPDTDCNKGFLRNVAAPTTVLVLVVFFAVRALVNHRRHDDSQ